MSHVVISIGNSDNKLTQIEWSDFVGEIRTAIEQVNATVHFFGGASTWEQWQNVAWVIDVKPKDVDKFLHVVQRTRKKYRQDSAFVVVGDGMFI